MAKKRARTGKKWGNALGGYAKQNRKGGKFTSGFSGVSVNAMPAPSAPKQSKGQRRLAEYQKSQKKARNKKIAKRAAIVAGTAAVVGGSAYAVHRSGNKLRSDDSFTSPATAGNGKYRLGSAPQRVLSPKEEIAKARAERTKTSTVVGTLAAANATIASTASAAHQINRAVDRAEQARKNDVNTRKPLNVRRLPSKPVPQERSNFQSKNAGAPVVTDSRGVRVDLRKKPNSTGLDERGRRLRSETAEFAGGDWENEMDRHFTGSNRGHWETGNSGIARDTRKDRNEGKKMRAVTLEASDDSMHPSSRNRGRDRAYASPLHSMPEAAQLSEISKVVSNSLGSETLSVRPTKSNRRSRDVYRQGNSPATVEGFSQDQFVSGTYKTHKVASTTTAMKTTSGGKIIPQSRMDQAMGRGPKNKTILESNPHMTRFEKNYATAFEDAVLVGEPVNMRQQHTYARIHERANSRAREANEAGVKKRHWINEHGGVEVSGSGHNSKRILPLDKFQGRELQYVPGLDAKNRRDAKYYEDLLSKEGHAPIVLNSFESTNTIAGEGTYTLGKKNSAKKSSKRKKSI